MNPAVTWAACVLVAAFTIAWYQVAWIVTFVAFFGSFFEAVF